MGVQNPTNRIFAQISFFIFEFLVNFTQQTISLSNKTQVMKNKPVSFRKSGFLHVVVLLFILMLSGNLLFAQQENRTMPEYKNGMHALMQFIGQNLRYPVFARDNCISGKVLITFKVTTEGTLDSIVVAHSVHDTLGKEAVRVLKLTENDWIPAKINDSAYNVFLTIPINFTLQKAGCLDVNYYFNEGVRFFEKGKFEKAIENYNAALILDPWHIDALYNCAVSHLKLHQFEEACVRLHQIKARGLADADELLEMFCK